ncbi:MAG: sugar phosphate nucleotidyltransferase [Eubacterium sp.]
MDYQDLFIKEKSTVLEAMKQLDTVSKGILYITDEKKLLAALTDGDVRRHLLKGGQLDESIKKIANYHPRYIFIEDKERAQEKMQNQKILSIPVVNHQMEIQSIYFLNNGEMGKRHNLHLPVVMMAGGKGTRLYPYTKVLPKPLIPIGDLPIAEHIINKFVSFGCNEFHLIVNHKKQMIKAYFSEEKKPYTIHYYDETEPLGTGGGLSLLKGKIKEPFFLTNCDIIVKGDYSDIVDFHKKNGNTVTIVCAYKHFTIPYGVITMGEGGDITEMIEKPEYSFLTNTGFYLVEPEVLDAIEENKNIGFPDIIQKQKDKGRKIAIYPVSEKSWLDMGQVEEMEAMRKELED